jgi:hypothetical protein
VALGRGLTFEEEICRGTLKSAPCSPIPDEARRLAATFTKLTASVAADKRDVTILLPHISRFRRRGAAWIVLRDWTSRSSGAASALLTTAASSRPHSSVLQKDGFISKISVQLPPSPPTGIGPSSGPRWRFA